MDFSKIGLNFNGNGVLGTATAGTATNIDFKLTEDDLITGASFLLLSGANIGDYIDFQVVDRDGVYYPAGTLLSQFCTNWYVSTDKQTQDVPEIPYPAKVLSGLVLRLVYNSTGTSAVKVAVNYHLHKVMF